MADSFPSILCVDDDAEVLEALKEYFTHKGFIVLTANNGVEEILSKTNVVDVPGGIQ